MNCLCKVFFIIILLLTGFKLFIVVCDVYVLMCYYRYWSYELERRKQSQSPRLLIVILKCFWWRLILHGFLQTLQVHKCKKTIDSPSEE